MIYWVDREKGPNAKVFSINNSLLAAASIENSVLYVSQQKGSQWKSHFPRVNGPTTSIEFILTFSTIYCAKGLFEGVECVWYDDANNILNASHAILSSSKSYFMFILYVWCWGETFIGFPHTSVFIHTIQTATVLSVMYYHSQVFVHKFHFIPPMGHCCW